jgi:phosphate transport system substrate-binding protein
MMLRTPPFSSALIAALALLTAACGKSGDRPGEMAVIRMDGSSTVFPIAEAVAEEFMLAGHRARVTVGLSGTGGGFKKLCRGEIDVSNASRPILKEEMERCREAGVRFIELPVAFDAITIVVNPENTWVKSLTIDDLKKMWEPAAQGQILRWNQVRPEWPDERLMLFGPGADSGTFDYFTEAVVGKAKASRGDYTASEDDNVLVQGVATNVPSLGYFGFAHYAGHREHLRAVPIQSGPDAAAVVPDIDTVLAGNYQPLSRPLFIYVAEKSAERPEIRAFVEFYLGKGAELVGEVGFVPLPSQALEAARAHFANGRVGTVFGGTPEVGVTIDEIVKRDATL